MRVINCPQGKRRGSLKLKTTVSESVRQMCAQLHCMQGSYDIKFMFIGVILSCVYCWELSCVYCCSFLVYIVVILCVFVVLFVYCCFYFRRRTAGWKSVFGRSCDRPPRHRFFLVFLCLEANAEMVPKIPSCH